MIIGRRLLVVFLILPALLEILFIAKSITIPAGRDLVYVDHRVGVRNRSFRQHVTYKNDTSAVIGSFQSSGEHPTTNKYPHRSDDTPHNPQIQKEIPICFITSQFSSSRDKTDHLFDVRKTAPRLHASPVYQFFAFSNLPDLKAPGWEIVVKDLRNYTRWITQSRWPKFLAFQDDTIQQRCKIIFYIDGILSPKDDLEIFQTEARKILESPVQLAQRVHPYGGGAEAEFKRITQKRKDTKTNVEKSLEWLREQPDYDKNCALYENSMFGYSIDSQAFRKAATFFWDHYSKEEDSWRDQPLWCYTLDHFNITPLLLTGNGKDTLFDQVNSRTAKGSHKYKSESVISAADYYESLKQMVSLTDACWLDTNGHATNSSLKPTEIAQDFLTPICPDTYRRLMAPEKRTDKGLTISIPYFAQPGMLTQQLSKFVSYPRDVQEELHIIIVDSGSPSGLRAIDHINITTSTLSNPHIHINNSSGLSIPFHFDLSIVRINHKIAWNEEGSHNLAFYLAKTRKGLILDLRMVVPVETIQEALTWDTTGEIVGQQSVAHKFNRKREDGTTKFQQTCALVDIQEYWNSGGMDEDFAGNYGYGTSPHFWHQWEQGGRTIAAHDDTFLLEKDADVCDSSLLSRDKANECRTARSVMDTVSKDGKTNRKLWQHKKTGSMDWLNAYLRFNWTVDF